MHRSEPSRLQSLALQLADKINNFVDSNERILETKQGNFFLRAANQVRFINDSEGQCFIILYFREGSEGIDKTIEQATCKIGVDSVEIIGETINILNTSFYIFYNIVVNQYIICSKCRLLFNLI